MTDFHRTIGTVCASALVVALAVVGCNSTKDAASSGSTTGYKGLGSIWTLTPSSSSFTLTYDANKDGTIDTGGADMRVEGSLSSLSNGFQKLVVTTRYFKKLWIERS